MSLKFFFIEALMLMHAVYDTQDMENHVEFI